MTKGNDKAIKFKKKVKIPDEQTETPGTPMGNFQGHNVNEYGKKGYKGSISEDGQKQANEPSDKKEEKPLSFNEAEPKFRK